MEKILKKQGVVMFLIDKNQYNDRMVNNLEKMLQVWENGVAEILNRGWSTEWGGLVRQLDGISSAYGKFFIINYRNENIKWESDLSNCLYFSKLALETAFKFHSNLIGNGEKDIRFQSDIIGTLQCGANLTASLYSTGNKKHAAHCFKILQSLLWSVLNSNHNYKMSCHFEAFITLIYGNNISDENFELPLNEHLGKFDEFYNKLIDRSLTQDDFDFLINFHKRKRDGETYESGVFSQSPFYEFPFEVMFLDLISAGFLSEKFLDKASVKILENISDIEIGYEDRETTQRLQQYWAEVLSI